MLENYIIHESEKISNAIIQICKNETGTIIVVTDHFEVLGVISDGEIRQAYLNNLSLDKLCTVIMNKTYYSVSLETPTIDYKDFLTKFKLIPVLNNGKLIDVISRHGRNLIPIAKPSLQKTAIKYVNDCLETNWISSQGDYVNRFERHFSSYTGLPNVVSVSNGTAALELALLSMEIGAGDEVIVPDFTFAATVNSVISVGAKPILVDVDPKNWMLDIDLVCGAITKNTKAIICVDIYGQPFDVRELRRRVPIDLKIIQDSAEALGGKINGIHTGRDADAVTFSFFANKIITTGEGGIVCFADIEHMKKAELIKNHGMSSLEKYVHVVPGRNLRMTNIQAAIGCSQLESIDDIIWRREEIFKIYRSELSNYILEPLTPPGVYQAPWLFSGVLKKNNAIKLMNFLKINNIDTRPLFSPMHMQPAFASFPIISPNGHALDIHKRGITLPTFNDLTESQQAMIISCIKRHINGN